MDKYTRESKESKRAELVELTTVCLIKDEKNNKYLLQNRVKKDWFGYAIPGGHVEPSESITLSVIREMKEETGLDIRNPKFKGVKQFKTGFGRYMVFIYKTTEFSGELKSSDEGAVEWVDKDKVGELYTVPNLDRIIEIAESSDAHELYYVEDSPDNWRPIII